MKLIAQTSLPVLKTVAEKRNFKAAALELKLTPSAVTQIVQQLETRLGIALLHRTTRSTSLTEAGERFLAEAVPAIEQILGAITRVGSYAEKPSGLLRLNVPQAAYKNHLAEIVQGFVVKYPDVSVEIFSEDRMTDIVEGGFDAGIRLSDILAKDMVAIKLFGPIRFVAAASPKYLNKFGRPKHPKELLTHNCIVGRIGNGNLYDRWEFENKGREFQVKVKGSLIFNDSSCRTTAALAGCGVIYTSEDFIIDEVKNRRLEVVCPSYASNSEGLFLYYSSRSQVQPKLRAFISHLKTSLEDQKR